MTKFNFNDTLIMKNSSKYFKSSKKTKSAILSTIQENTGLHRKAIIRRLNKFRNKVHKKHGGSVTKFHKDIFPIIKLVKTTRDNICAELLHPFLNETLDYLDLKGFAQVAVEQVCNMKLGTLKLKIKQAGISIKGRSYYRSHTANLKQKISVCTTMNQVTKTGHVELDFVDHNGGDSSGQFARTLCCTDVFNQFTVKQAIRGKSKKKVQGVFDKIVKNLGFKILELHTDNESSLLQSMLLQQTKRKNIKISRSRSYHKEDNGHVEQKNGDKIRKLVGHHRYDTDEQEKLLNEIYDLDDLIQNHFIPSMKLKEKVYNNKGKLIKRVWDKPLTPYQRILLDTTVSLNKKSKFIQLHSKLNLVELIGKRNKLLKKLLNVG